MLTSFPWRDTTYRNMKILLTEDNSAIRNVLRMSLEAASFIVDEAENGEDGSFLARTNEYDLVILDNMLPKKMGKQVCKEIREAGKTMPVLLLSMKSDVNEKIELLDCGADDYMTKPFSFEELLARMRALMRRPTPLKETVLTIGDLTVHLEKQQVFRGKKELYLTRKEFTLLAFLAMRRNRVVTRGQLLEHVWDMNANPFSNTIEAHVLTLRKKIGDTKKRLIRSIPGRGYKLVSVC
jgi:DNA-binding response OmpR family regulator